MIIKMIKLGRLDLIESHKQAGWKYIFAQNLVVIIWLIII